MKILHFLPALRGGGIKTFVCSLSNEMAQQGHDVTICTIFKPEDGDYAYSWLDNRVKICHLGKEKIGFSLKEIFTTTRFVRKNDFDIVNIHSFFQYYVLAILLLHKKVTFFYTVHSDAYQENTVWENRILFIKRLFFHLNWLRPITISKESQRSFNELYHCSSTLIYNGVAKPKLTLKKHILDDFRITKDTRIFIHVGRITQAKNQVVLCKVFKRLINEGYDVSLLIIGKNQDNQIFNELADFFSVRIQYLGERDGAVQYMSQAEALCLPSLWEGMPITILEAMAVGCITIASPVGGIPEIIENDMNGFISKDASENEYYKTMIHYLNMDDSRIQAMRSRCQATYEKFNISHTAATYLETYKHAK